MATIIIKIRLHRLVSNSAVQKRNATVLLRKSGRLASQYAADDKLDKVLENPQVIKTPVVRNGKQSTLGYLPDVWKNWN